MDKNHSRMMKRTFVIIVTAVLILVYIGFSNVYNERDFWSVYSQIQTRATSQVVGDTDPSHLTAFVENGTSWSVSWTLVKKTDKKDEHWALTIQEAPEGGGRRYVTISSTNPFQGEYVEELGTGYGRTQLFKPNVVQKKFVDLGSQFISASRRVRPTPTK